MEELERIVLKESQDKENISIDEIKKLDKKLGEALLNLDPSLKNALLVGLKKLIKENFFILQNSKHAPENREAIVYALQIFGYLNGMNLKIDGNYALGLDSPEFKSLFSEAKKRIIAQFQKDWDYR